jgi:iron complex transport system substrate-binding protein
MRALLFALLCAVACFGGPPKRIVSQAVGTDEMLLAVADPSQIAALSHISRSPEFSGVAKEAAAYPQLKGGDAEDILKFKPDLVLMTSYSRPELVQQVRKTGVQVCFIARFESLEDAYANLRLVAQAVGHPERAEAVIRSCRQRVEALAARLKGVKPVRVLAPSTYGYIAGTDTTFQDLCDHAGALNVAAEAGLKGHAPTPGEQILGWRVETLVLGGTDCATSLTPYRSLTPFRLLPAVQQGRCALIPGHVLSSVTHLRIDGYERLARQLHPGAFK